MTTYKIYASSDMGHLEFYLIDSQGKRDYTLPFYVFKFVHNYIQNTYIDKAEKKGFGGNFYCLCPGLKSEWSYKLGNDTIVLNYDALHKFNEKEFSYYKRGDYILQNENILTKTENKCCVM